MRITLPDKAEFILRALNARGYDAFVVGGCVRDSLIGRIPGDWDITTSARPEEIKALFRTTIDTGIEHGTVTVVLDKESYEVTTYRIDGEYLDGRHPEQVEFTNLLKKDLERRDFTINAMAYHPDKGLVDLYGGMRDLGAQRIRCVGKAEERFREDALRILRALRFASQLNFEIEGLTLRAVRKQAESLRKISAERIQKELTLLLCARGCGKNIKLAYEAGVTRVVLPELDEMMETGQNNPHHCFSVGEHCIEAMELVQADQDHALKIYQKEQVILRWAMLLHDVGKPATKVVGADGYDHFIGHPEVGAVKAEEILKRLKFDNETIGKVTALIRFHDYSIEPTEKAMRRAVNKIGQELMPMLFRVRLADISAQNPELFYEKKGQLEVLEELYRKVVESGAALAVSDLAVNGKDLMELGIPQGKQIGDMLARLLAEVLEEPAHNTREWLLAYAAGKEN